MSDTVLVSTRKGLFILRKLSGSWKIDHVAFLGDNVTLSMADARDGTWYAALDHGHFGTKLHRSEDRGVNWTEVAAPKYPEVAEGQEERLSTGQVWPSSLKLIWSLEPAGADRPAELWCGTIPGGLFHSQDRGDSWELVRGLWDHPDRKRWFGGGADYPGIHSILVDPNDSKHVLVGVSCGGVWETTDAGLTWVVRASGMRADFMPPDQTGDPVIQDPHRVVACPAAFDQMWCQHHCGIFKTGNGGQHWEEISEAGPSTFGFAVAVHPKDPNTAWFVPAVKDEKRIPKDGRVVVTRTRDGGASFDVLTRGLPGEHAYDLVFRHALDIDATGDRLAFGSTTGSLWLSEDQGDSWQGISQHLPPIYAVRFASSA